MTDLRPVGLRRAGFGECRFDVAAVPTGIVVNGAGEPRRSSWSDVRRLTAGLRKRSKTSAEGAGISSSFEEMRVSRARVSARD